MAELSIIDMTIDPIELGSNSTINFRTRRFFKMLISLFLQIKKEPIN